MEQLSGERSQLAIVDSVGLDDAIVFGLASTAVGLAALAGIDVSVTTVRIGDATIEVPIDVTAGAWERFDEVCRLSRELTTGWPWQYVAALVLTAEGWTVTRRSLRTPLWMIDHMEVPLDEVCRLRSEATWVVGCMSGIAFGWLRGERG